MKEKVRRRRSKYYYYFGQEEDAFGIGRLFALIMRYFIFIPFLCWNFMRKLKLTKDNIGNNRNLECKENNNYSHGSKVTHNISYVYILYLVLFG